MELKEGENGLGAVEEGSCGRTVGEEAKLKRGLDHAGGSWYTLCDDSWQPCVCNSVCVPL